MRSLEERYNFLVSRLRVENPDFWEGDALLTMKPFCFGFSLDAPDQLTDIAAVIDLAIDTAESDTQYKILLANIATTTKETNDEC